MSVWANMKSSHSCAVAIMLLAVLPLSCLGDFSDYSAAPQADSPAAGDSKATIHVVRDGSSIEMCQDGAVSLAVEPGPTVTAGDVLWNFPARDVANVSAVSLCDVCGYLPSYIISASPSTAPCTPPAAVGCEVLDLQTRPATFGEVFDLDFLQVIAAIVVTDTDTFGDLIRCNETSAAAPAAAEEPLKVPEDCSVWNEVYPETGVCKYTECCVEPGLAESTQCFLCEGDTCDNGCGTSGFQGQLVPDSLGKLFDFSTGCCNHDHCWSSALDRQDCDAAFYRDNILACNTLHGDPVEEESSMLSVTAPADLTSLAQDMLTGANDTAVTVCRMIGWMYFATVASAPGDKAHVETQAERIEYEMSGNCTCPPGVDASVAPTASAPPPASDTTGTLDSDSDSNASAQEAPGGDTSATVGTDTSGTAPMYSRSAAAMLSGAVVVIFGLVW